MKIIFHSRDLFSGTLQIFPQSILFLGVTFTSVSICVRESSSLTFLPSKWTITPVLCLTFFSTVCHWAQFWTKIFLSFSTPPNFNLLLAGQHQNCYDPKTDVLSLKFFHIPLTSENYWPQESRGDPVTFFWLNLVEFIGFYLYKYFVNF